MRSSHVQERLQFGLKGDRTYVQGAEIYARCRDLVARPRGAVVASLAFHEMLEGDATLRPIDDGTSGHVAEIRIAAEGRLDSFGLFPDGPPSLERESFEEDRIVAATEIGESEVVLDRETGFDSIEEIVAMVKAWHLRHLPDAGKWLFVRLDHRAGEDLPSSRRGSIQGRLAGRLGSRMTRFVVEVDGCESLITFGSRR